jgi:hypothetical protein
MRSSDGVLSESEGRVAGAIQVSLHRRREGVDLGGRVTVEEVTHAALGLAPQLALATYPDASSLSTWPSICPLVSPLCPLQ